MNFIDLKAQYQRVQPDVQRRINAVLEHGQYINGPEIAELESALAAYAGTEHCVAVSSGTDALLVAMMALGIGPGDEVITTPFTFIATGEMIRLIGAQPVFVDIDAHTYNIDPALIESKISPRTKAIMPVSLYGQCADFQQINEIADRHGLPVIEDAAQSFGATQNGVRSCALSTIGCTSFFPSKPLGGYGDGGACFTGDPDIAKSMREIRNHGQDRRYHHPRIGLNARLDTIQAAILLAKLDIFPEEVALRGKVGERYTQMLAQHANHVVTPHLAEGNTSVFAQYTIRVTNREQTLEKLKASGIPTAVHYPTPLHHQPALAGTEAKLPVAEKASGEVMSLPMHPYLKEEDMQRVVDALLRDPR